MANEYLKIRIASGNAVAMGPGKADLLETIDACGSISSAAKQMHMSYRRAWELVDVPRHLVSYALHVTAASILFLVESHRAKLCWELRPFDAHII